MSALISSLSELIALLIQSFNLGALLPSFVFVLLNYVFVRPYLKELAFYRIIGNSDPAMPVLLLAALTITLGYLLTAANTQLIRWFEGYPLWDQFPFDKWRRGHEARIRDLPGMIWQLETDMTSLNRQAKRLPVEQRGPLRRSYGELEARKLALMGEQLLHYPQNQAKALPTKLGNIIASAEEYPELLFGIDTVLMWPYMAPALTKTGYAKYMEHEKSTFDLLLNSTVLVAVFGLEIAYLGFALQHMSPQWGLSLVLIAAAVLALAYLTTDSVMGWAATLRTAFILHRDELRESLGLRSPKSYEEEYDLWKQVSNFYRRPSEAKELAGRKPLFVYARTEKARRTMKATTASQQPKEEPDVPQG